MLYKPELVNKLYAILNENLGKLDLLNVCCRNQPDLNPGVEVINICPGCDKRFRENYDNSTTISLWEILAKTDFFPFPDYQGKEMTVIDACPTRSEVRVHEAIRTLLKKMNITLIEPAKTGIHSTCCGDSFYDVIPTEQVKIQMKKKASEMPTDDIVVYCVSCSKSVYIGGKKPHYIIDLLFNEETIPKTYKPNEWHKELDDYIANH
ncbi:(Fe-S)-binding protein [Thermoplasmatota archaeon]